MGFNFRVTFVFVKTLEINFKSLALGYGKLNEILDEARNGKYKEGVISGKEIFTLYDTFGFPPEMTQEIAESEGFKIDLKGFDEEMEKQRLRGKSAWKGDPQF